MIEERIGECPLGAKCETVKDDAVVRCPWFVKVIGQHPQTGEQMDKYNCAMTWLPILLIENTASSNSAGAAIESFRNEMVKGNGELLQLISNPSETKLIK